MKVKSIIFSIYFFILYPVLGIDVKTVSLDKASVEIGSNQIVATTGKVAIKWDLAETGLKMCWLSNSKDENLIDSPNSVESWSIDSRALSAKLINISADISDDEGFTSQHIRVVSDFQLAGKGIDIRYEIWIFPGANGVRTQLFIRKNGTGNVASFNETTVESIRFVELIKEVEGIGYYNDTQNRNTRETPILKEELCQSVEGLDLNWANLASFRQKDSGIILVKESPKCVNQQSIDTGGFKFSGNMVSVYGAGLDENSLTNEFQPCWATWNICYKGGNIDMQLALKEFDRVRYPLNKERDMYVMANTWGSGDTQANSKYASREENILDELKSASALGIDVLQVDDGWQGLDYDSWFPVGSLKYLNSNAASQKLANGTEYKVYPEGWKNIRREAGRLGLKLGLWAASWIPKEDLMTNYTSGDFKYYKLDFAKLNKYSDFYDLIGKTRSFIVQTKHDVRVNWDVTENDSRMGYFYGREYGNIYLENRKPQSPASVIYRPWLVLRDAWHVAHYLNLNKFQVSFQNIDMVNTELSDANLHSHGYCLGITLMGSPIFFQETHLLAEEARSEIRALMQVYKKYRSLLYDAYVFPIGDEPTNASWTGFQNYIPGTDSGFITVFRELNNKEQSKSIKLNFIGDKKIELTNLLTSETLLVEAKGGAVNFTIDHPAGFMFLKYRIL